MPFELVIENRTASPLTCTAALAHWFSDALGTVLVGGSLTVRLWHEAERGVLYRLNDAGDRMPVEAIDCANLNARAGLDLPIRVGAIPSRERHVCRPVAGGIACEGG
ncbi:MAG: hypothetical protein AAFW98_10250 [Pseudomonadota bacterium]